MKNFIVPPQKCGAVDPPLNQDRGIIPEAFLSVKQIFGGEGFGHDS